MALLLFILSWTLGRTDQLWGGFGAFWAQYP